MGPRYHGKTPAQQAKPSSRNAHRASGAPSPENGIAQSHHEHALSDLLLLLCHQVDSEEVDEEGVGQHKVDGGDGLKVGQVWGVVRFGHHLQADVYIRY